MSFDVFVSYNSQDRSDVVAIVEGLRKNSLTPFFDRFSLEPGKEWRQGLADVMPGIKAFVICVGRNGLGEIQRTEIEAAFKAVAAPGASVRIIPVLLPGYDAARAPLGRLQEFTWVDFAAEPEFALSKLVRAIRGEPIVDVSSAAEQRRLELNPYKGLRAFTEDDAAVFFGRREATADLYSLVCSNRTVVLVGASGAGKTSLVAAGLLPGLRGNDDGIVWASVAVQPGGAPLQAVARVLAPLLQPNLRVSELLREQEEIAGSLARTPGTLSSLIERYRTTLHGVDRVLVFVDQLEEVFGASAVVEERQRFFEELVSIANDRQRPVTLLLALRRDQASEVLAHAQLAELRSAARFELPEMTEPQIRDAIVKPAQFNHLTIEDGLVDRILDDMRGHEQALPVLNFLLDRLWRQGRSMRRLTTADYRAVGGIRGVIAKHADDVFRSMSAGEQRLARGLFLSLVKLGDTRNQFGRRRLDLDDLAADVRRTARRLAEGDARLLIADGGTVEIAHEAVLADWQQLRTWIEESRADLELRDDLERRAIQWDLARGAQGEATTELLDLARKQLDGATRLVASHYDFVQGQPLVRNFVSACQQKAAAAQIAADQKARKRSLATAVFACGFGLASVLIAAFMGWLQWNATQSRGFAIEASNTIVNRISRRLEETEGVPAKAVSDVLATAAPIVDRLKDRETGRFALPWATGNSRILQITAADIIINEAETQLTRGQWGKVDLATREVAKQLDGICDSAVEEAVSCAVRKAQVALIRSRMHQNLMPARFDEARSEARNALKALAAVPQALSGALPAKTPASDEAAYDNDAKALPLIAENMAHAMEIDAVLGLKSMGTATPAADGDVPAVSSLLASAQTCLSEAVAIRQALSNYKISRWLAAMCQRQQAELLALSGDKERALKLLNDAKAPLITVVDADATEFWGKLALAEITIAEGRLALSGIKSAEAIGPAYVTGLGMLRDLAFKNVDNYVLRNRYIQLTDGLSSQFSSVSSAELIEVQSTRIRFIRERLASNAIDSVEREELMATMLKSLPWLYWAQIGSDNRAIVIHSDQLTETFTRLNAELTKPRLLPDYLRVMYWVGQAQHAIRSEDRAIDTFITLNDLASKDLGNVACGVRDPQNSRLALMCYLSSFTVSALGNLEPAYFTDEARLEDKLQQALAIAERALKSSSDNNEFRQAVAALKYNQGRRKDARGETTAAMALWQSAAEFGSRPALGVLRDRSRRIDAGVASTMAGVEQQQRDFTPLVVEVSGVSTVLKQQTGFTAYLTPSRSGADPVQREIERLKNFYGVTLDDKDKSRLREIVALAEKKSSQYTARELRQAFVEILKREESERPFRAGDIDDGLQSADKSLLGDRIVEALESLDKVRAKLVAKGGSDLADREYQWGHVGLMYLRIAHSAAVRRAGGNAYSASSVVLNPAEIERRAIAASEEALQRALLTPSTASGAKSPGTSGGSVGELKQAAENTQRLADHVLRIHNTVDSKARNVLVAGSRQTYPERYNEMYVAVLEKVIAFYNLARTTGDVFDRDIDLQIIATEQQIGNALSASSGNGVQLKEAEQVAQGGNVALRKSMTAFQEAYGHLTRFPKQRKEDWALASMEVDILIGIAKTHKALGETTSGLRSADEAVRVANAFVERDRADLDRRLKKAEALEVLAQLHQEAAQEKFNSVIEVLEANETAYQKEVKQDGWRPTKFSDQKIDEGVKRLELAIEKYKDAIRERLEIIKIDLDKSCVCAIRTSVDNVVGLLDRLYQLKAKRERAVEEAQKFAQSIVDVLQQVDSRFSRASLSTSTAISVGDMAKELRKIDERFLDASGRLSEIGAVVKYVAVLAYDTIADFSIRARGDYLEASKIYGTLADELKVVDVAREDVKDLYAVTLSNQSFALLMTGETALPEAKKQAEKAYNLTQNFRVPEYNIIANWAHVLMIEGKSGEAVEVLKPYLGDWWWANREHIQRSFNKQLASDFAQLERAYPKKMTLIDAVRNAVNITR